MLGFLAGAMLSTFLLTGCSSHKQAQVSVPPPPAIEMPPPEPPAASPNPASLPKSPEPTIPQNPPVVSTEPPLSVPPSTKPLLVQTGLASWYGAPYNRRRSSDGKIYDMNAMTAAHRTLPLGSIVRVTNLKTGHATLVRITDRGPFIPGRILDLSLAAAKQIDVWRAGLAMVRLEVLEAPAPLNTGGRWAVQIGAFDHKDVATELVSQLTRRYHTAKVLSFNSPVGDWWVRVRVLDDNRKRAEEIARETHTSEGAIFLVRLD